MKLRKGTFKHIESELFSYEETKREIELIRADIIHSTPFHDNIGGGRSNTRSDPTAIAATLLTSHRKLEQMERIVNAIDRVYESLPAERKELVRLKYWTKPQTLTWDGIARELNVSRRQAIRWRDDILHSIADRVGWR